MPVQTVIQLRTSAAATWTSANPTLALGEVGCESDTNKLKISNGTSTWTLLDYSSGGRASTVVSDVPPTEDLAEGMIWFNSAEGNTYIYYDLVWVEASPSIAGPIGPDGSYYVSATIPSAPEAGSAWLNTNDGRLYIYEGTTWFEPTNNQEGPTGATGATGATGPTGPAGADGISPSTGKIIAMSIVFGG